MQIGRYSRDVLWHDKQNRPSRRVEYHRACGFRRDASKLMFDTLDAHFALSLRNIRNHRREHLREIFTTCSKVALKTLIDVVDEGIS